MGVWFKQRDSKESKECESCKEYVAYGQFYYWYSHPALGNITSRESLIVCSKCTKREVGKKNYIKLTKEKKL